MIGWCLSNNSEVSDQGLFISPPPYLPPQRLCRNHWRACFLSFRPKGEILNSGHLKNQDFSAAASK